MPGKLLWIINPVAGKAETGQHALGCVDCFVRAGWDVNVYTTQAAGDARRVARERAAEFQRIVCSGGDGTLGETVAGLMDSGVKIPLGYIPAGTTNDFASSLGLQRAPEQAAQTAAGERIATLDIGRFGDRYFTYVAAFGLFTEVSYTTPQPVKNWFGRAAYLIEGIKSLSQVKEYKLHVEAPEVSLDGDFVLGMVSNSTSVGGFKALPQVSQAKMDDGLFEVLLLRRAGSLLDLQNTVNDLVSSGGSDSSLLVRFKTPWVSFRCEGEAAWTLDGEFGGSHQEVRIENLHRAVSFLVPPQEVSPKAAEKNA